MASIGFAMAACIWWINFEFVEDDAIKSPSLWPRFIYLYGHYFIVSSIVADRYRRRARDQGNWRRPSPSSDARAAWRRHRDLSRRGHDRKMAAGVCSFMFVRIVMVVLSLAMIFLGQFLPPLVSGDRTFSLYWFREFGSRAGSVKFASDEEIPALVAPCEHSRLATVHEPRTPKAARNASRTITNGCTCGCASNAATSAAAILRGTSTRPSIITRRTTRSWRRWKRRKLGVVLRRRAFVPMPQKLETCSGENLEWIVQTDMETCEHLREIRDCHSECGWL